MKPNSTSFIKRIQNQQFPEWVYPIFLLLLCVLAYGILIPWLGFYSDDWVLVWSYFKQGNQGIQAFYNLQRPPFSAMLHVIIPLFKFTPWLYQVFAILMRWVTGCLMWLLLRRLWPQRREISVWVSALFILYPAYTLQNIAITTGNILVYLVFFLLSLYFTIRAVQASKHKMVFSILAIVLSGINLVVLEYFFLVELVRPILIWYALDHFSFKEKLWKTFKLWLPYLILFLLVCFYRAFFFPQQVNGKELILLEQFRNGFGLGIIYWLQGILQHAYMNIVQSWAAIFQSSIETSIGMTSFIVYWILVAGTLVLSFVLFYFAPHKSLENRKPNKPFLLACLWITNITILLAGLPFIAIGKASELAGFYSRVNLTYMFGVSIMVVGLIELIPIKRIWKISLVSLLVAFSLGWQFRAATVFRLDWKYQQRFYWKLTWRIPDLKPGTLLAINDIPEFGYEGYTALTSAVDYIYTRNVPTDQMKIDLIYGSEHPNLFETPNPVLLNWPNYQFQVNRAQIVYINYVYGCPRVMTSQYKFEISNVPDRLHSFIELSSAEPILYSSPVQMDTSLFGKEPEHDWCYYFSKADLARQQGNWDEVVNLENQALEKFGFPKYEPRQIFPLIEGLAIQGKWSMVQDLFIQIYLYEYGVSNSASLKFTYLDFWQYLDTHSTFNETKAAAQSAILAALNSP